MPKKRIGELLRINVAVTLSVIIGAGVLVFLMSYLCASAHREEIKFTAALLAGAAAIYSAYYVGASLRLQVSHNRRKASFEILGSLNRPEFVKVRNFIEKEVEQHENMSARALYEKVNESPDLDDAVTLVMGILEDMTIAIETDYVDEDMLYISLLAIVERNWSGLRGWVEQLRQKRGDSRLFCELERLVTTWQSGKRLSDGGRLPVLPSR